MKRQIILIHGGDFFKTYDEYIDSLKNWKISIEKFRPRHDWKTTLQEALGDSFDVLAPQMPNKFNAKYLEWKIWFERMFLFLNDDIILVGHSLGAMFLAKYLSENDFPKKIKALYLVAPPHNQTAEIADFRLPKSLEKVAKQSSKIFLYHSKDDPVVPFTELAEFQKQLPSAKAQIFNDRGHFNQDKFPELISDILS